jgi:hypothetical protein
MIVEILKQDICIFMWGRLCTKIQHKMKYVCTCDISIASSDALSSRQSARLSLLANTFCMKGLSFLEMRRFSMSWSISRAGCCAKLNVDDLAVLEVHLYVDTTKQPFMIMIPNSIPLVTQKRYIIQRK